MSLRIAIIGAGMAGVSAGRLLADRGHTVTLLEKSRGCGGRCATKRWEGHIVDHGAQYFTMRHPDFCAAVQQACGEALCRITAPVLDENGVPLPDRCYFAGDALTALRIEDAWRAGCAAALNVILPHSNH